MRILVTGGLGFVGSTLVDKLVILKHKVTIIDNLSSTSSSKDYKNSAATYIIEDIQKISSINFTEHFDIIYHLAGLARIQPSFENPLAYVEVNISGTAMICELAKKHNAKLIYSSSSSINNGQFKTPYTFSKWGGEAVLKTWRECYNLDASICRFYNVYGSREPKTGDYATVIRKFIRQYQNNKPLTIVGDGEQRRDFTHVNDITEGLIKVASNTQNSLFHLGRGVNYSINELAAMFEYDNIKHVPLRKGEGLVTLADYQKTFTALGWEAKYNLKDYIKEEIK
jgi:UDP-glucose 4-epimerase